MRLPAVALLATLACGCGSTTGSGAPAPLTVFVASSAGPALTAAGRDFGATRSGVAVTVDAEGSQALVAKLSAEPGAAAVLITAGSRYMDEARARGLVGASRAIGVNHLVVAVPTGNPAGISRVGDLGRPGLRLVIAGEAVPVGTASRQMLARAAAAGDGPADLPARAAAATVSQPTDDAAVVAAVASGEVDAGIVYASDLVGATRITGVPVPAAEDVSVTYLAALTAPHATDAAAVALLDYLTGPAGGADLRRAGIAAP